MPRTIGVVDCDVHNTVPAISELFDYLPERWRDYCVEHGVQALDEALYPPGAELSARPEARAEASPPGSDPSVTARHVLDRADVAILNCLYAVQPLQNEDWACAMVSALNDWQSARWLAADDRFRASIVVSLLDPARAAAEIERLAHSRGFAQVLLPAFTDIPLGRRRNWPIYQAAQCSGLPVAIHPAMSGGNPTTATGWPSYSLEDQIAIAGVMQSQLVSLVCEGVFQKFPELTVVLAESGATWLPSLMWRLTKNWRALRREIPWVTEAPSEIVRHHVRLTVAPFDAPDDPSAVVRLVEQIGSAEVLLFASDYPHWHARDAQESLLCHLSEQERTAVLWTNAAALYRLATSPRFDREPMS